MREYKPSVRTVRRKFVQTSVGLMSTPYTNLLAPAKCVGSSRESLNLLVLALHEGNTFVPIHKSSLAPFKCLGSARECMNLSELVLDGRNSFVPVYKSSLALAKCVGFAREGPNLSIYRNKSH